MTIGTIFDLTDHAQGYQLSLANLSFKETCDRFAQFKKIVTTNEQTYFKTYEDKTYYEIIVAQIDAVALSICEFIREHMEPHLQADFLRLEHWQAMNAEVMPELSSSTRMSTIAHPHNTNSDAAIILNIKSWINDAYIEYRETILKLMLQKKATSWKPWRWEHHGDKGLIRAMKVRDLIFEETGLLQKLQVLYRFFTGYYHSLLRQYRENAHSFSTIIYNVLTNTDHYKSLRLFLNLHQREFTLIELKRNLSLYQQPDVVNARLQLIVGIRQQEADSLRIRSQSEITSTLSSIAATATTRRPRVLSEAAERLRKKNSIGVNEQAPFSYSRPRSNAISESFLTNADTSAAGPSTRRRRTGISESPVFREHTRLQGTNFTTLASAARSHGNDNTDYNSD